MELKKERDYSFDAIRGFCMWLIVLQHFCHRNPEYGIQTADGYIYFFIDLFAMQAFFFLSGFFSKKPEKGRAIAFPSLLWPVIMIGLILECLLLISGYPYERGFGIPPYAMWFMVCLFYYRLLQTEYLKVPHIFGIACIISVIIGFVPGIDRTFAIAQAVNWFPYFLLGYYCRKWHIEKVRSLKFWQTLLLAAVLIAGVIAFVLYGPDINSQAVQIYSSNEELGLNWWQGLILKPAVFIVSSLFLILLFNIFPNRKGMWSHVGQNTMPVYVFHIGLVMVMKITDSVGFGLWNVPDNSSVLYYVYLIVLSLGVTLLLTTAPFRWLYNIIFVKSYDLFRSGVKYIFIACGIRNRVVIT